MGQSDGDKLKDEENRKRESLELGEVCVLSVANKQLAGEVTQLKIELRNLKAEIKEIKAVKDLKVLKRQNEELFNQERIIEQGNEVQQKEGGNISQELMKSIMKLQKEIKLARTDGHDRQIS